MQLAKWLQLGPTFTWPP